MSEFQRPTSPDANEKSGSLCSTRPLGEGLTEISIRGDFVTLVVVPEAGGKILQLIDNESGFNVLWQNPRVPVGRTYAGAPFDDVWCGGWDDIFPTDAPCEININAFHDHGDLWIAPWTWSLDKDDPDETILRLSRDSVSLPCTVEKTISLSKDPRTLAWSHIYLGRLYDVQPDREHAMAEYAQALAHRDARPDTRQAAEAGLTKPFALPKRAGAPKPDDDSDLDPTGKAQKDAYKPNAPATTQPK